MTSSETPTEPEAEPEADAEAKPEADAEAKPEADAEAKVPAAVARDREPVREPARPWLDRDQLIRLAVVGLAVAAGWAFILWSHNLRFTAPVFFLWVGWLAVVLGVHYLWRTGTATADASDEDAQWWRPAGAREELEREKRSLLKAIKEVEFDHQTGKMSEKDAQAITRVYRGRAIEVIKALDEIDAGGKRSVRQQIEREVKARLAIEGQSKKGEAAATRKKKRSGAKAATAAKPAAAAKPVAKPDKSEAT